MNRWKQKSDDRRMKEKNGGIQRVKNTKRCFWNGRFTKKDTKNREWKEAEEKKKHDETEKKGRYTEKNVQKTDILSNAEEVKK